MPVESILSLLSVLAALCSVIVAVVALRRNQHGDTAASATDRATMSADIRYIRDGIYEIKQEYKAIQQDIIDIRERLVKVEQSTKSAHNRIDGMAGGDLAR